MILEVVVVVVVMRMARGKWMLLDHQVVQFLVKFTIFCSYSSVLFFI